MDAHLFSQAREAALGHIKLWDNILDCPKIHRLSDKAFRCWTKLLVTALRNGGRNGELPLLETLVFRMRMSAEDIEESIKEMHRCCLLEPCPDNPIGGMPWRIHDWDDWQAPKDPGAAERQARWRVNQALRNAQHNGVVTANITPQEELKVEVKNSPHKPPRGQVDFVLPDWIDGNDWADYEEMRRKIRKPMTPRARTLAVRELDKLRKLGSPPSAVLQQSILRDYQGLFPVAEHKPNGKPEPGVKAPIADTRTKEQRAEEERRYQELIASRKAQGK
jgi:hypothetical protein